MTETQFQASQAIQLAAGHLVAQASQAGLVVTIETVPQLPLAMGNYSIAVNVREARHAPAAPAEPLGMFGHHPDPAIDFVAEVEAIEAERADLAAGLPPTMDLHARTDRAMTFRVGGDAGAVAAKQALRAGAHRYPPLSPREIHDLTCMHAGAPWPDEVLAELGAVLAIYDRLRATGARPVDPADVKDAA